LLLFREAKRYAGFEQCAKMLLRLRPGTRDDRVAAAFRFCTAETEAQFAEGVHGER
jgi:hypothetical protein